MLKAAFAFFLAATMISLLCESAFCSTLIQTQLSGVKIVSSSVFVSQYLPKEIKDLEGIIKENIDNILQKSGLLTTGRSDGLLSVDISGDKIEKDVCTNLYWIQIKVRYSEEIILKRSPSMKLPNQSFYTWEDEWINIIELDQIQDSVMKGIDDSVGLFIEKVETATSLEKEKTGKR
jgi:hypothetical protein